MCQIVWGMLGQTNFMKEASLLHSSQTRAPGVPSRELSFLYGVPGSKDSTKLLWNAATALQEGRGLRPSRPLWAHSHLPKPFSSTKQTWSVPYPFPSLLRVRSQLPQGDPVTAAHV